MLTAIIQARLGSTRFPKKILANICSKPLIWHVIERLRWSKSIEKIVLATTINQNDDNLYFWAKENNINVFRGSEEDVLARFYDSAKEFKALSILRITADDPFKDPDIIDKVYEMYLREKLDFAYNNNPPTFPEGLDTEIFSFSAIERAYFESKDSYEREHVTQFFYRHPELFSQKNYCNNQDLSHLRWTIDNSEDFLMVNEVYKALYKEGEIFKFQDILKLFKAKPHLSEINKNVKRSDMYNKMRSNE
jgi:spore coat polysaccharide biosynthesis protein SpsF